MKLISGKEIKLREPTLDELKKFTLSDVIQCLSSHMQKIYDDYRQMDLYSYNMTIHYELLKNIV